MAGFDIDEEARRRALDEDEEEDFLEGVPANRFGEPEDAADVTPARVPNAPTNDYLSQRLSPEMLQRDRASTFQAEPRPADDLDINREAMDRALREAEMEDDFDPPQNRFGEPPDAATDVMPARVPGTPLDAYLKASLAGSDDNFDRMISDIAGAPPPAGQAAAPADAPRRASAEPIPSTPNPEARPMPSGLSGMSTANTGAMFSPETEQRGDLREASARAEEERTRERRLKIAGLISTVLGGITGAPIGMLLGNALHAGSGLVNDEGRREEVTLREQIEQGAARSRADAEAAYARNRQAILDAAQRQQEEFERGMAKNEAEREAAQDAARAEYQQGLLANSQEQMGLTRDQIAARERQAALDRASREAIAASRRRGGGSGGGTPRGPELPAGGPIPMDHPDAPNIRAIERIRREIIAPMARQAVESGQYASEAEASWAIASQMWRNAPEKQRNAARGALAAPQTATSDATADRRDERTEQEHAIAGWARRTDGTAPTLSTGTLREVQDTVATDATMRRAARRLSQIAQQLSAVENAAARARLFNSLSAEAIQLHEQVTNGLRRIGGYGVPQKAELERMAGIAPPVGSAEMFMGSAPEMYRQMSRVLSAGVNDQMRAWGYERGGSTGGSGGARRPTRARRTEPFQAGEEFTQNGVTRRLSAGAAAELNRRLGLQ